MLVQESPKIIRTYCVYDFCFTVDCHVSTWHLEWI